MYKRDFILFRNSVCSFLTNPIIHYQNHLSFKNIYLTFFLFISIASVNAQTVNWVGAVSTEYGNAANWNPSTFNPLAPTGAEIVNIDAGAPNNPIQIGGNATKRVARLNTLSGAQLTVKGILYPNNNDILNGNVSVEANADFNIRSNVFIGNGGAGTVTVTGGSLSSRLVMYVGRNAGGNGVLNIWGGKVNAGTDIQVGTNGASGLISFKGVGALAVPGNKVAYLQGLLNSGKIIVEAGRTLEILYNPATNSTLASIWQDPNSLLKEYANDAVLDNGTIKATIRKSSGEVISLLYKGVEMVSQSGKAKIYYDWTSSYGFETMFNCTFSIKKLTDSIADLSFKRVFTPAAGHVTPADIDIHYVLKRGDTGLYTYSILEHQPQYPKVDLGSWRMVMWLGNNGQKNVCEKIYVDSIRHWEMPSPSDYATAEPTGIQEIVKLTTGVRAGKYDCKYEYSKELWELDAVGHASDVNKAGSWFVYGSHEFFNDGPTFSDLNAAAGIIHATLNGLHYNSKGFEIPQGEYWRKVYGPFLIYFNGKDTGDESWADAKARAKVEKEQWPYSWMDNTEGYPLQNERGSVSGKFTIKDPYKAGITGANAWIGVTQISNADNQWQFEAKNYHYWVKTDAQGNFTIPDVRPGTYSLYAIKNGETGEYSLPNVTVTASNTTNVGELVWNIQRNKGGIAWEIGVPDRKAGEFKNGAKEYFEGYIWNDFGKLFKNPIEYNVTDKNWDTVLNYAHSPYQDSTGALSPWRWKINFNLPEGLPKTGNATLTIAYASSDHANQFLFVNNENSRFTNFYPPNAGGNALLRQDNHAKYGVSTVSIPMSRLKAGKNTISLVMASTQAMANHIMYDYLSLEVPGITTARFVATPVSGKSPLTVAFDASSSLHTDGGLLTYAWDFGDGTTGEGDSLAHVYTKPGEYTANLIVTDSYGASDTTSTVISVLNNPPVAEFTATPASGYSPLSVSFDATQSTDADNDSLSYAWDFGDNTAGIGSTIAHAYNSPGQYSVKLIVTDTRGGIDTVSVAISCLNNPPTARIIALPVSGYSPHFVSFDASASGDKDNDSLSYVWSFGDGASGEGNLITHQYTSPGEYTVTLLVTDTRGGSDTTSIIITALNNSPVASFTATPTSGYAPLAVAFDASATTDSDNDSLSYSWTFGDGSGGNGKTINHTYLGPGNYTAVLLVSDTRGGISTDSASISTISGLKAQYRARINEINPFDNHIKPHFQIVNTSNQAIPYSELTLRYWYTREGYSNQVFWCDYAALGTNKVKGKFISLPNSAPAANYYVEVGFDASAGMLKPNAKSGEIQTRFNKTDWSNYNELNDYSYDPLKIAYTDWDKVTLYRNGKLFWGTEPSIKEDSASENCLQGLLDKFLGLSEGRELMLFPNPLYGSTTQLKAVLTNKSQVQISIHNAMGREVFAENLGIQEAGELIHTLNLSSLPKGTFVVRLITGNTYKTITFVRN